MVKNEWSEQDLLIKAQNYCSIAEHCVAEVKEKLYQWGADSKVQDKIMDALIKADFINETRYATAFVHDKVAFQGWGREKIRMMLIMKHLSSSVIEDALAGIDMETYNKQINHLIEQKLGSQYTKSIQSANPDQLVKLARFLAQRGFTTSEIRSQLRL